jgi:hypothetical protein
MRIAIALVILYGVHRFPPPTSENWITVILICVAGALISSKFDSLAEKSAKK